jgi:hypothetical protein
MPYRLEQATPRLYFVVDDKGKRFSKKPMYKKKAREQQKALYASEGRIAAEQTRRRRVKGGEVDTAPTVDTTAAPADTTAAPAPPPKTDAEILGEKLKAQEDAFLQQAKKSLYGIYAVPFIPPHVMASRGIPWYLAQHPNQYSANPNQVLVFRNEAQFLKSPFYKKYSAQIVEVPERKGYATEVQQILPKKDFRIVFMSRSPDDTGQYYMDATDANQYMDVLDDAKESNILIPTEFMSQLFMKKNRDLGQIQALQDKQIWQGGYKQSQDELTPVLKQQQEEIQNLQSQVQQYESELQQAQQSESGGDGGFGSMLETGLSLVESIF